MKENIEDPTFLSSAKKRCKETPENEYALHSIMKKGARIFFVGIGGVSMSGLSELSGGFGYTVGGSDMHDFHRSRMLREKGIQVFIGHDRNNIDLFLPDLLVYTAAIMSGNPEIDYAREKGIPVVSRGDFLGFLTERFDRVINISGTHGKTTTTSMLSQILIESGRDPTVHLGAEYEPFGGAVRSGSGNSLLVSEACEYRRSFLNFRSTTAAITNIDFDHADCFRDIDEIIDVFAEFSDRMEDSGFLIIPVGDENVKKCVKKIRSRRLLSGRSMPVLITTGLIDTPSEIISEFADYSARNIEYRNGYPSFDVWGPNGLYTHVDLQVPGRHNIENALTAIACAAQNGGSPDGARTALRAFRGAEGRFSVKGVFHGAKVVTDYAHHPAEIRATLQAASQIPHKKMWVVFQPLTFNRVKIFGEAFINVFLPCAHVIFADIFSDREVDTGEFSSSQIADQINRLGGNAEYYADKEDILHRLSSLVGMNDLVLIIGPEDIRSITERLSFD